MRVSVTARLLSASWKLRSLLGVPPSHRTIFRDIYRSGLWGSSESVSGPGSTRERGAMIRGDLISLLRQLDTRSLLDAPCGDFNWMAEVADTVQEYIGADVVPELIENVKRNHQREGRTFRCADIVADSLPRVDVILCRDGLVHFSNADIAATLRNFERSGSRYLLTTTFTGDRENRDIATGGWRPINLERPPFSFPPPLASIDEHCLTGNGQYRDKRLALWPLAR